MAKTNNFDDAFKRLKTIGISTQQALASELGITQGAVADAKKRGSFPNGWAVDICNRYGISLDYLVSGKGLSSKERNEHGLDLTYPATRPPKIDPLNQIEEEQMWKDKYIGQMELNQRLQTEISALKDELMGKPLPPRVKKKEGNGKK
ncbi:MAG: bacteriophage CI repressor [bacterium]|nr:bacteriophage CI repressor [bacterium]